MKPKCTSTAICRLSALLVIALSVGGCIDVEQAEQPVAVLDEVQYASHVQPYVGLRCGSLDCHGVSGRGLRLYAEHGLRLRADLRGEVITAEEIRHNVAAFAGASPDIERQSDHIALVKGLAVAAGGFAHVGGDIWSSTGEDGYQCILAWLESRTDETFGQNACAAARAQIAPE